VEIISKTRVLSSQVFNIDLTKIKTQTGKIIENYIVDPIKNAVIGLPMYQGKIILVKAKTTLQKETSWELPGGLVDNGELPLSAVRRKIEETTGFEVSDIARLGTTTTDNSLIKKEKFYFIVTVSRKIKEFNEEYIEKIALFNPQQIKTLIAKELIIDERTITGISLAERKGFI
jgi:ADP-ribose pyrophosphatase